MTSPTPLADSDAVVIGAGIAGLTAARALADHFRSVILLDRDQLADTAAPRRSVPQGAHAHVLLVAGQRALDQLFPGVLDELVTAGAVPFDPGVGLTFYRYGSVWPRLASDLTLVTFSRPLLEQRLRRRLAEVPNVRIMAGIAVSDLLGESGRITGVKLDDGTVIDAALVVDCTGRGSRSDRWLAGHGYPPPRVSEVKVGVGYASRFLRRKPGDLAVGEAVFVLPAPPEQKRAGTVLPVEGDRWLISLGGWHGEYPTDDASFAEHARSLPHPEIAELLDRCEPLSDVVSYTFPSNRRRHFEELTVLPVGYVALGDSVCSFNPVYGQGMTCASLESVALGELVGQLGGVTAELSPAFYGRTAEIIATPWQFASGADFNYPETVGDRPRGIGLLNRYSRRIQLAAQVDAEVRRTFTSVQHLIMSPDVLRKPGMMLRVLLASRRALRAQRKSAS